MDVRFRYKGSAKSGNYAHAGRPGKVGGSAPKSSAAVSAAQAANIALPPDDAKYEYFYHATRHDDEIDGIAENGLKPGSSGKAWLSKDEVRDRGGGFVIVRVPKGKAVEGIDVVEADLKYREWTIKETIPPSDVVRLVRVVTDKTGYRIREDHLAEYALTGKATQQEIADVPEQYHHWFTGGKEMIIQFMYKGSSYSGHHGHAGRIGKVGGSAPKSFSYPTRAYTDTDPKDITIAGVKGSEWMDKSARLSERLTEDLRDELSSVTELDKDATEKYISRLNQHRAMVMEETLRVSQHYNLTRDEQAELMDDVVHHDTFDKYDGKTAVPYINKIALGGQKGGAGETKEFWKACNDHHDNNPHHPEYWSQGHDRAPQMPTVHLIQMAGDWIATAKYFNTPKDGYYRKYGGKEFTLHPNTRVAAERELGIDKTPFPWLFPRDFKEYKSGHLPLFGIDAVLLDTRETLRGDKGSSKSGNYAHGGRPGKVGGSSPKAGAVTATNDLADIASKIDVTNGPVAIGKVSATVYRSGGLSRGEVYFADDEAGAAEYSVLHSDEPVKAYRVEASNVIAARSHFQLYSHLYNGKKMQDATYAEEKKSKFKIDSIMSWRIVQDRMMAKARAAGYDGILFTAPPLPAKRELVLIGKVKNITEIAPTVKEMTIQFRYKGSASSGNRGHGGRPGKVGGSTKKATSPIGVATAPPVVAPPTKPTDLSSKSVVQVGNMFQKQLPDAKFVQNWYTSQNKYRREFHVKQGDDHETALANVGFSKVTPKQWKNGDYRADVDGQQVVIIHVPTEWQMAPRGSHL